MTSFFLAKFPIGVDRNNGKEMKEEIKVNSNEQWITFVIDISFSKKEFTQNNSLTIKKRIADVIHLYQGFLGLIDHNAYGV